MRLTDPFSTSLPYTETERWAKGFKGFRRKRDSGGAGEGGRGRVKKKSGTNTRCPARTPPHLDQHLISIDTTPRSTPHLGPNSAQAATSRSSGGNLAIRSSAALPTPTQLSARVSVGVRRFRARAIPAFRLLASPFLGLSRSRAVILPRTTGL